MPTPTQYVQYPSITTPAGTADVTFIRNGVTQSVVEDTVTPANNRPLPVKETGPLGDVTTTTSGPKVLMDVNVASSSASPNVNVHDGAGNSVTSQLNGAQRALDVGIDVAGVQVDPRSIRALTSSDTVTAVQATGTNFHTVVDSGSISVSNFPATQAVTQSTSPWVVDGSGFTQPVSGTVTANQGTSPWVVDGSGHTQPVSGTVTANIGTTNGLALDATLAKLTISQGTALGSNTQALAGASVTTSAPSYTTGQISPLSLNTSGGLRVDGSGVTQPVSLAGRSKVNLIRNDYSSVNVTTAAYVQLVASTAATINLLDVFDSSGQTLKFAVGGVGVEVDQFYIYPGGNGRVELNIPSGSRLSVKAVSATASTGELDINTFS